MRFLTVGVLVSFVAPVHAADKDEDKAKVVVGEFLKALKANDRDRILKTVDVPFSLDVGAPEAKTITKADELKQAMGKLLEGAVPDKVKALEAGKVYDMAGVAKYVKDDKEIRPEEGKRFLEQAEKLVGKSGYMVMLVGEKGREIPGVLVRIKDGKALIASLPQ